MLKHKRFWLVAFVLVLNFLMPAFAGATQLLQAGLRLGRLGSSASTGNDLLVTFKLNTTPTSVSKIKVTFPSGFNITAGSPVVGSTFPNTPASITAPPGLPGTATATSNGSNLGGTITVSGLTSASLNNTTLYGFTVATGTITNPAAAGQYNTTVESDNSGGSTIDLTTSPVSITSGSTSDQVTVTATVAPIFSFSLSANSDTIPSVDYTASKTSTGVTMTVSTNAPLGYTAYVKSAGGHLSSATTGANIPTGVFDGTPDTLAPGTTSNYGFVPTSGTVCSPSCGGTLTYDGEYAGQTAGNVTPGTAGAFNGTNFASFVSRSGYTASDSILLQERVAVTKAIPPATDYTDTLTIVAAGNF